MNNTMKEEEKRYRRRSGRFLGLTLKTFTKETENTEDEKTTFMKRLGNRCSFRKNKQEKTVMNGITSDTDSASNVENSDSTPASSNDTRNTEGAGHTPKIRHLQRIHAGKTYSMLERSLTGSDSDIDDLSDSRKHHGQCPGKQKKRCKLRRSMSTLCGTNKSKLVPLASDDPKGRKVKCRRSFGGSVKDAIITRSRSKLIGTQSSDGDDGDRKPDPENKENGNESILEAESLHEKSISKKIKDSLRQKSLDFLSLSITKHRPKRYSYEQMKKKQDDLDSGKKSRTPKDKRQDSGSRQKQMRKPSGWRMENNDKIDMTQRRSSLGVVTPRGKERRYSGVYTMTNMPLIMTCGSVMTDSPPDGVSTSVDVTSGPEPVQISNTSDQSISPVQPTVTRSDDCSLPWFTTKRKRLSEKTDRSTVNRSNAGHTPLPPRKKCKSYHERLIN